MTNRDIIVIGASLGGLEALCKLVGAFPAELPAAVMVVLHTSPDSPKLLAEIFDRFTPLPVAYGVAGEPVLPGRVYVASPGWHLIVTPSERLGLDAGPKVRHCKPAADRLFQSAAEVYGDRVIGVVLTGGDGDGTDGLRSIKGAGGLAVVQDPADAVAPGMPNSALAGAETDLCLPLHEIGPALVRFVASSKPA